MGLLADDIIAITDLNTGFRTKQAELRHATATACTTCTFDTLTHSAVRLDCPECSGLGKTLTYASQICMVRTDFENVAWEQADSGETLNLTVTLHVGLADIQAFKHIRDNEFSFMVLEGYDMKVITLWPTMVSDEYVIVCQGINVERFLQGRTV
jgi:predicted RNA-binding Zn-ribbon protein involved in translation (DUF1610 family)